MNRKRVNLTIEETWLKIAKKYAIDNNTSVSRVFETALKRMLNIEEDKGITREYLENTMHKILDRIDKNTEDIKNTFKDKFDELNL